MQSRTSLSAIALCGVILANCGGGGGSPSPGASPGTGFVAANGPITALGAANGTFGSTLLPGSQTADFIVESASQPATPRLSNAVDPSALTQFSISVAESGGLSASSLARKKSSALVLDRLPELPPGAIGVESLVATLPRAPMGMRTAAARVPMAALGDQRAFKVLYTGAGGAALACPDPSPVYQCTVPVTATLEAVSQHAYVWVDDNSLANPSEFPDSSYFTAAAANFDQYYAIETQAFGPAFSPANVTQYAQCDANANLLPPSAYEPIPDMTGTDPHVHILITDVVEGNGESGYFYSGNLFAQQVMNCSTTPRPVSNELPLLVIGGDDYPPAANSPQYNPQFWLTADMPRLLSHEFQHYLHAMNKYYGPLSTGRQTVIDAPWIDEGCSMLAEDLAANGMQIDTPQYSYIYLREPSLFSLTAFVGYQPDPTTGTGPYSFEYYTAGNYGAAYLMLRYLYDRFGGTAALHALYADFRPATPGLSNVNPILAATGNSETWTQLFGDWSIALAAQSTGITTDPRYGFSPAVVLRGSVQVASRRSPPLNVRTFVFGGPQPPETFDAAGNLLGYVPLGIGSPATVDALDGAANFFAVSAVAGGATIRAQTGTADSPQGAIVQGNLPTPMPTTF